MLGWYIVIQHIFTYTNEVCMLNCNKTFCLKSIKILLVEQILLLFTLFNQKMEILFYSSPARRSISKIGLAMCKWFRDILQMSDINPTGFPHIINNFLNCYCRRIQSQCRPTYNLIFQMASPIARQRKTINSKGSKILMFTRVKLILLLGLS